MAVKIRLTRMGKRHDPKYRIIVVDERKKRDGRYIEKIGFYDPVPNPHRLELKKERLDYWVACGAIISTGLSRLLKKWKG